MVFKYVSNDLKECERLEQKYKLENPYTHSIADFWYCVFNEDQTYCLVCIGSGRGRQEKQPDIFAFITPNGIAHLTGYKDTKPGEAHWAVLAVNTDDVKCENKKELYELMKQALMVYSETEYVKAFIDVFPEA